MAESDPPHLPTLPTATSAEDASGAELQSPDGPDAAPPDQGICRKFFRERIRGLRRDPSGSPFQRPDNV